MDEPTRSLVAYVHAGLGNRLRVLLSARALAEATHRAFTLCWTATSELGCNFEQLFENDWHVVPQNLLAGKRVLDLRIQPWSSFPNLLLAKEQELRIVHHNWLILPERYPDQIPIARRCEEMMAELVPVPAIQARIDAFRDASFRSRMIGVHLRRGDFIYHHPEQGANLQPTFQVVDRWLDEAPDAGILLCSAGAPVLNTKHERDMAYEGDAAQFARRYGGRVVSTKPRSFNRRALEAIEDAVLDLWLLRQTDYLVGTAGSSFSEMAAFARPVPTAMTAGATVQYQAKYSWLVRAGVAPLLSHLSHSEFGREVPYPLLVWRYKRRLGAKIQGQVLKRSRRKGSRLNEARADDA